VAQKKFDQRKYDNFVTSSKLQSNSNKLLHYCKRENLYNTLPFELKEDYNLYFLQSCCQILLHKKITAIKNSLIRENYILKVFEHSNNMYHNTICDVSLLSVVCEPIAIV